MSTWILLRGLTREQRHWGEFPEVLSKEFPNARVVALELPGNGGLNAMTSPATIAAMASQGRAEVARLGIPPPYHLLAMSMGAMVATAWAANHPEEIEACVLINTSFGFISPICDRLRPRTWPTLLHFLLAQKARDREELVFKLTSKLPQAPPGLIDEWVAIRKSRPVRLGNALRQVVAAARFLPPSVAPVPTLVLASAGDRLVHPGCSMEIARCWNCPMAIHPTAGHDLPLDDGAWVAREIFKWLTERNAR
jgi:pimeloyl-ACP methyl ester carboxylesterase